MLLLQMSFKKTQLYPVLFTQFSEAGNYERLTHLSESLLFSWSVPLGAADYVPSSHTILATSSVRPTSWISLVLGKGSQCSSLQEQAVLRMLWTKTRQWVLGSGCQAPLYYVMMFNKFKCISLKCISGFSSVFKLLIFIMIYFHICLVLCLFIFFVHNCTDICTSDW